MKYYSLNRKAEEVSFKDAVIKGLADFIKQQPVDCFIKLAR